jgi:hypothetical protein
MDTRRARILVATIFSVSLAIPLLVAPAAAATCTLAAPGTVAIGTPLAIQGSGFPASSTVDVSLTVEGGSPDQFTVQSDASGAFQINLTPEAADAGKTTVVATAGAVCTAQVTFTVGASGGTATPKPTQAGAGAGAATTAPRTDAEAAVEGGTSGPAPTAWQLALLMLFLGLGGLMATLPARSRELDVARQIDRPN